MRRGVKSGIKKEKIIMLATATFALTAMTMTGVYVNNRHNQNNQDGYTVDLSSLDDETSRQISEIEEQINKQVAELNEDDLDVEVQYEETNAGDVWIPREDISQLREDRISKVGTEPITEADAERELEMLDPGMDVLDMANKIVEDDTTEIASMPENVKDMALSFDAENGLAWPITGRVILNYSMDKAVYFETLNQYRYNPSMVIEAVVGEPITAAADGKVISIRDDVETGGTLRCDLGDGYELIYGQLENFTVSEGDYVTRGQIIGYVASPSIFYTKEGSNVYFELLKDGEPVNPLELLK